MQPEAIPESLPPLPEFRITLNNYYVSNLRVQKAPTSGYELAVRIEIGIQNEDKSIQDIDLGWFVVEDRPDMVLRYRDETSWALLPTELKQASRDKGWSTCTPEELIGILWNCGILQ